MLYVTDTPKDVATATHDLEEAVKRNKFGVLHVHDLQKTLQEKGVDFPNACRILEVSCDEAIAGVDTLCCRVGSRVPGGACPGPSWPLRDGARRDDADDGGQVMHAGLGRNQHRMAMR